MVSSPSISRSRKPRREVADGERDVVDAARIAMADGPSRIGEVGLLGRRGTQHVPSQGDTHAMPVMRTSCSRCRSGRGVAQDRRSARSATSVTTSGGVPSRARCLPRLARIAERRAPGPLARAAQRRHVDHEVCAARRCRDSGSPRTLGASHSRVERARTEAAEASRTRDRPARPATETCVPCRLQRHAAA